jgi:hypothetical protein
VGIDALQDFIFVNFGAGFDTGSHNGGQESYQLNQTRL